MSHLTMILSHLELAIRLHAAAPWMDVQTAYAHVEAAEAASTDEITSELLLGIAFVESRFDTTAVSRVEGATRKTGRYPSTTPPAQLDRRASLYCGPLQTYASSWSACMGMRDLKIAYAAAAAELAHWMSDRRVRGNVTRALAGHGCGNFGVRTGTCNGYPRRVLTMQRQLRFGPASPQSTGRVVAST
ncbi:MAG TPA: hypothetical protein VGD80_30965 [Kofleriaceae bacterium]